MRFITGCLVRVEVAVPNILRVNNDFLFIALGPVGLATFLHDYTLCANFRLLGFLSASDTTSALFGVRGPAAAAVSVVEDCGSRAG